MGALQEHAEIQLATFILNGERYGVDVMSVREIIGMPEITKTVNSPRHILGVTNLRGSIVPIVSLRRRFGMPDPVDDSTSCIAVIDFKGTLAGFVIDEISDVLRVRREEIQPTHGMVAQPWIEGILSTGNSMIVWIDLEHLA